LILLALIIISCICVGVGVAALASYPLYWGLLAGWLCPSVAVVTSITALAICPRYWANRTNNTTTRLKRPEAAIDVGDRFEAYAFDGNDRPHSFSSDDT
jgi:membrane protein implicated in regulation of membrane protease activity